MKVKDLIEYLQAQDPEETVYLVNGVDGGFPLTRESIGRTEINYRMIYHNGKFVRREPGFEALVIYGE